MRADAGVHMSLLSTVYSQSWPAPDPVRGPRKGFFGKRPREAMSNKVERPKSAAPFLQIQGRTINPSKSTTVRSKSAIGVRTSNGSGDAPTPTSLNGQLGLDKGTLHWKSWSSYKLDCEQEPDDLSLYRLTTETFRRLSQQVKDVSQQLNGKYHNSGFKSYYIVDDKTVPALRRSQLAASLPSQPPSICSPTPNESVSFKPSEDLQCTTVRGAPRKKRPQSSFVRSTRVKAKHPPRPKSSFATILGNDKDDSSSETKDAEIKDTFDQITPKVIEKLGEGEDEGFTKAQPGPFNIVKDAEKPKADSEEENEDSSDEEENDDNDDGGGGSGDDDDDNDGGDEDDDDNSVKKRSRKKVETDHSNDEASDNEMKYRYRETPDLDLLPEDLDEDGFRGKIDYNTSNMPKKWQSSHAEPLRPPWCHMDLLELSEFKNWRKEVRMVPDGIEEHVMDRLIEMEKLQADTAHWERCQGKGSSRPPSSLQVRKGWNADAAVPTERAQSALSKSKQSKNCVENCMQLACAGDCRANQSDRGGCPYCKQLYCTGSCAEYEYHLYVRTARNDDDVIPTRPKSCRSCRVSSNKNSVKSTVNANTVVLGRPKSAFATFSSAKHQVAKPKAFAILQTAGTEQVSNDLAKLGLKAPTEKVSDDDGKERPHTAKARPRPKGRDAILPGKSFQSQRRNSLTEDLISTSACSMNSRALRARSARMRAQKRCKSAKK